MTVMRLLSRHAAEVRHSQEPRPGSSGRRFYQSMMIVRGAPSARNAMGENNARARGITQCSGTRSNYWSPARIALARLTRMTMRASVAIGGKLLKINKQKREGSACFEWALARAALERISTERARTSPSHLRLARQNNIEQTRICATRQRPDGSNERRERTQHD